jgi:hypothetical protein
MRVVRFLPVTLILMAWLPSTSLADGGRGATGQGPHGARVSTYAGRLVGYPADQIDIRVVGRPGRPATARFTANDVELVCETGQASTSFPRIDLPSIRVSFRNRDTFQGQRYRRSESGDWAYYEVKGRLGTQDRGAHGYLYFLQDPFDPPPQPNRADCSTGGQLYLTWTARRTGRSDKPGPCRPVLCDPVRPSEPTPGTYRGTLAEDPAASIAFDVSPTGEVLFRADQVPIGCEGSSSEQRYDFAPGTSQLLGGGFFEGRRRLLPDEETGFQELFKYQGVVRRDGSVHGFVFYASDLYDPATGPSQPGCSTDGLLRFTAERTP